MEEETNNMGKLKLEHLTFTFLDYAMFVSMLVVSSLIGIYFGIFKKQNTTSDYLFGGKNMGVFPIAISLAASYVSAITVLGMPAEVYMYGTQYAASCISGVAAAFITGQIFLPVFYELQLTSSFEYLELRFDKHVRKVASFFCFLGFILTIPIVIYVPALAFNLVSGFDLKYITPIICTICIFYTTIGGLRAVVWTDTIQFLTMNGTILVILILGIPNEGGLKEIWKAAEKYDRIHFFDFNTSLYERQTFWAVNIGMFCSFLSSIGVNQMCIQRFLSVPTLSDANKVLYIYCAAIISIKAICLSTGLIMFARYQGCDPFTTGIIKRTDQILPYYVMDTTRGIPGLPGLFVAGVFSAALSTMSTLLNTASGILYKDFICAYSSKEISEVNASLILKSLVVIIGSVCMLAALWVDKLGSILQLTISFNGISAGAMLGIFVLGMLFKRANSKGAVAGGLTSITIVAWMFFGNSKYTSSGAIHYPTKPFSTESCEFNFTTSNFYHDYEDEENIFFLYRISYMWYSLVGTTIVLIVGLIVSYLTEPPDPSQVKLEYFSPIVRKFLSKAINKDQEMTVFKDTEYKKVEVVLQDIKDNR